MVISDLPVSVLRAEEEVENRRSSLAAEQVCCKMMAATFSAERGRQIVLNYTHKP